MKWNFQNELTILYIFLRQRVKFLNKTLMHMGTPTQFFTGVLEILLKIFPAFHMLLRIQ